jgi:hypothetical protein
MGLRAHSISAGVAPKTPDLFVVTLRDDTGKLIGGMTCDLYLGGLLVKWAWISDATC